MKEVAVVIGWGWDWERIKPLIVALEETREFRFQVYVSGSALCKRAGAPVRLISETFRRPTATVAMYSELLKENRPEEAVMRASSGLLRIMRRRKPHILLTFGTDASQLAAAFAATALHIPQIHIIRGEERYSDERYSTAVLKLAKRRIEADFLYVTGRMSPSTDEAICVIEPYCERHPDRLIEVSTDILLSTGKNVLFVCAFADKASLRGIRRTDISTVIRYLDYRTFLRRLPEAELLLTNTEAAFLEARLCGTPAVHIRSSTRVNLDRVKENLSSAIKGVKRERFSLDIHWDTNTVLRALKKTSSGYKSRQL